MRITQKEYNQLIRQGMRPIINGITQPMTPRSNKIEGVYDSKLERDYAQHLKLMEHDGTIRSWLHHPMRLRLADGTYYTPDFLVVMPNGGVELHETKGFMREASRVRLNVAADKFRCFTFRLVKRDRLGWQVTRVP